jgi:uncharacterized protein
MIQLTGLAGEFLNEIRRMPVMDCHEHLPPEAERLAKKVDVTTLFSHYCKADLEAAGLPQGDPQSEVLDTAKPLMPRWEKLKPYLHAIRHGSYAYPAYVYVRDVLGIPDINDGTVEAISERMQQNQTPGLYKRLIQDQCGIEKSINCTTGVVEGEPPFIVHLMRDKTTGINSTGVTTLERLTALRIHSLDNLSEAVRKNVFDEVGRGAVGYKVGAAYGRKIEYLDPPQCDAERVFARLRKSVTPAVSEEERTILEDYLMHRAVEACIDAGIPIVIHTGYQAGTRNDIRNARATHLWHLLKSYPEARFDLFHGSFPYVEDMVVLGKYFANVSLNMCWMHIMGPAISRRALDSWLDAVPVTKIFAFGGDYFVPEKIYGHLDLARANVATVLADKVRLGRMTDSAAIETARLLFYDNARKWYQI